jgi:protein-ribulosamine 3-kinase
MAPDTYPALRAWLETETGHVFAAAPAGPVAGGDINQCLRWPGQQADAFIKLNASTRLSMFEAEAAGLRELATAQALRVPRVLGTGVVGSLSVLALEWLDLRAPVPTDAAQARVGTLLATQHRVAAAGFGWYRDNTIGSTPQPNAWSDDWVQFFRERRLGYQLDLAMTNGLATRVVARGRLLVDRCGAFFSSYRPTPALLHGDLWGGNWAVHATTGEPVVFDPAVYYGDREADLAMTRLFGGFGPRFYAAYQAEWPLDPAAGTRRTLYNLYHVLNHYNLFGGGYAAQAANMIDSLLAEFG